MRARHEYGRIVEGTRYLQSQHDALYFITITCRGRGLSVSEAKENYLLWTNRLLSTLRANARSRGVEWSYVQVTEWQRRGHPHSHIITTYYPDDIEPGTVKKWSTDSQGHRVYENVPVLRSAYLEKCVVRAGLGSQYDISVVASAEACSRYVAKYLFKETMFSDKYPANWRRVRYSQSFPKLPEVESTSFVVMKPDDWNKLMGKAVVILAKDEYSYRAARARSLGWDGVLIDRSPAKVDDVPFSD